MRTGDPGPDRPWRMLRVGPDLLFARKKHASSGRRLSKVRPRDAVGCDATRATTRAVTTPTSSLSDFCMSGRNGRD